MIGAAGPGAGGAIGVTRAGEAIGAIGAGGASGVIGAGEATGEFGAGGTGTGGGIRAGHAFGAGEWATAAVSSAPSSTS